MIDFECVIRNKNLWIDLLWVKKFVLNLLKNDIMVLRLKMMKFYFDPWFMKITVFFLNFEKL